MNLASDFAISAVDPARSFVLTSCTSASSSAFGPDDFARSRLTTSTNLEILFNSAPNAGSFCDYQVVEYQGASVQRGTGTLASAAATTGSIAISPVDTTKSFVQVTWSTDTQTGGMNFLRARLTSATTIEIDREVTGSNLAYAWEVVEFNDGTTVQSGALSFSTLETSKTAALTSVDTTKTVAFLSADQRGGSHSYAPWDGIGSGWFTTGITNATTLTVEREMTNSVGAEAAWFVVEFGSGLEPIVHWEFDEGSGQTAADSSGNSRDATLGSTGSVDANDPAWMTCAVGGSALEFDGVDDYVEDPDGELYINGLTAFTASAWIKSDVTGTDRGFLHTIVPDNSDSVLGIRYDAAGSQGGGTNVIKVGVSVNGTNQLLESSNNIQTTNWQHVVVTWSSGNQLALYLDGSLDTPLYNEAGVTGSLSNATTLFVGQGGKDDVNGGLGRTDRSGSAVRSRADPR